MNTREKEALALLKSGNKEGLKETFELLYDPLCLFSEKIVSSIEVAEDLVQEVFIKFWEDKSYNNIQSSLSSFLYRSVRNKSISYLRKKKLETVDWIHEYEALYTEIEEDENKQYLLLEKAREAINELPPKSQLVYKSVVIDGLSYKAAAELHNISINTIKSQLKRATKLLSQKLETLSFLLIMELFFKHF